MAGLAARVAGLARRAAAGAAGPHGRRTAAPLRAGAAAQAGSASQEGKKKLLLFTAMLLAGLGLSQVAAARLAHGAYGVWSKGVGLLTMFCLSYLMIGVGQEFHLDKSKLGSYGKDYAIAMSAAGLPWLFVAAWLHYALPSPLAWGSALLMARFAAPTSAGILFSMLEAAGFKETWLFQKARILAIFDDLDTILLMIPLKMFLVGFKWELTVDAVFVSVCLFLAWQKLHNIQLPSRWNWTLVYAAVITAACEGAYVLSGGAVHLEVLLPAFTIGAATRMCQETDEWCEVLDEGQEERVRSRVATVFMLLVGLSMPSLFAGGAGTMSTATTVYHVFVVSVLMVIGKMLLLFTYRDEANLRTRLALSLGMCPRGEVGAGVIAISLGLGMSGPAVTVAVLSLATNLLLSSGFIMMIDALMRSQPAAALQGGEGGEGGAVARAGLGPARRGRRAGAAAARPLCGQGSCGPRRPLQGGARAVGAGWGGGAMARGARLRRPLPAAGLLCFSAGPAPGAAGRLCSSGAAAAAAGHEVGPGGPPGLAAAASAAALWAAARLLRRGGRGPRAWRLGRR